MKFTFLTTLVLSLLVNHIMFHQNEQQLLIEYDFYFYSHTGQYVIESVSDANDNLQTVVRNYNSRTVPGVVENISEKSFIYKSKLNNIMTYEEKDPNVIVHENLNLMVWELTNNTEEVLGYQCNEAKATFRGRNYVAYFTTDLPFNVSPWKFHGLPGVVLKIYTEDGKFKITANSIKMGNNLKIVKNPYKDKKSIPWEKFVELYSLSQKKLIDGIKALNAKNEAKLTFVGDRIDLITEADIIGDQAFDSNLDKVKQ